MEYLSARSVLMIGRILINVEYMQKKGLLTILPVMFGFFIMAFVDLVGLASNYVKNDFGFSDTVSNLISIACYVWFLVFSVPTGIMMNRYGRKTVVLMSFLLTAAAMLLPVFFSQSFIVILVAFALIGIGNTLLQVSLNPLVQDVVAADRLTGTLTLGQFIKSAASLIAPVLFPALAASFLGWKTAFLIYAVICLIGTLWLGLTPIQKNQPVPDVSFAATFRLLKDRTILFFFLGMLALVGADVGIGFTFPKILQEKFALSLDASAPYLTVYFLAKAAGAFVGGLVLMKLKEDKFYLISIIVAVVGLAGMAFADSLVLELVAVAVFGLGYANMFSIIFSLALKHAPSRSNEVSSLLIMGVAGGAVVTPVLGIVTDMFHTQNAAVIAVIVVWLFVMSLYGLVRKTSASVN